MIDIKHEVRSRDANKARGEAKYIKQEQLRRCFYYFKEFPEKCFNKNVFTSSL